MMKLLTTTSEQGNRLTIHYGINSRGYFSVTASLYEDGRLSSCGQLHEDIAKARTDLADITALHGCDRDGVPMHADANARYWLAGAAGGLGEDYHGGNGATGMSADECAGILCKHLRIDADEARTLVHNMQRLHEESPAGMWAAFSGYVEAQRPRWRTEADAAVAHHQLEVDQVSCVNRESNPDDLAATGT